MIKCHCFKDIYRALVLHFTPLISQQVQRTVFGQLVFQRFWFFLIVCWSKRGCKNKGIFLKKNIKGLIKMLIKAKLLLKNFFNPENVELESIHQSNLQNKV